jgi:hypothetical protein
MTKGEKLIFSKIYGYLRRLKKEVRKMAKAHVDNEN